MPHRARERIRQIAGLWLAWTAAGLFYITQDSVLLQPLVENAVRHGLGQSEEVVTIDVSAATRDGTLALIVSDEGPGLQSTRLEQPGIGLANTRSRLGRLYGERAGLVAENTAPHGLRVTITLPLRTMREEAACG